MATRKADSQAIAARCKAVGWRVDWNATSSHYKVFMPQGDCTIDGCNHIQQIHLSYSAKSALMLLEQDLNRHGLEKLEGKRAVQRDKDRKATLEEDRRKAQARSDEMVARAGSISRAAGPYAAPELIGLDWFIADHPAPWMRWAIITPELAKQILEATNFDNRKIVPSQVDFYAGIILSNQWRLTHQGMAIDRRRLTQDGQHRMLGIIKAGIAVPVAFFVGMDPDNFKVIDVHLARTAAQMLAKGDNPESNVSIIQSMSKLVIAYRDPADRRLAHGQKVSMQNILDTFADDAEMMREAVTWAAGAKSRAKTAPGPLAAARYLIQKKNGADNPYVQAFFRGYVTERKLDPQYALSPGDPRTRAREQFNNVRLRGKRMTGMEALAILLVAWNYVVQGNTRNHLAFRKGSSVPDVLMCSPLIGSTPSLLQGEVAPAEDVVAEVAAVA